jgi:hypothetical protein
MRPMRDADQGLRALIATLEHQQEGRRVYVGRVEELIELRQREIDNLRGSLAIRRRALA